MIDRIVDADSAERSDHDFAVRRETQSGDLVVRERVAVRFGMLKEFMTAGCDVHLVQTLLRSDPHVVPGAEEGGGPVVITDVDVRQYLGHVQSLALYLADLEETAVQRNPYRTVIFHVAGLGHEIVIHDIAFQGIDEERVPVVGEGHPEQQVIGREPDATVGVPSQGGRGV